MSLGDYRSSLDYRSEKPIGKACRGKDLSGIRDDWERENPYWIMKKNTRKKPGFVLDGTRGDIEKDPEIGKLYFTENRV